MKDFPRDDLEYKEIPSKPQENDPYHHHSWDFAYFCRYGHQYLTYLPWEFMSKLFFQKKYGSEISYLPADWTYVQTFVVFFLAYMARSGRPPGWQTGWLTYTKIRSLICYYLRCCLKSNVIVIAPLNCWLKSSHPRDGHPLSPGWSPTIHRTFTQHLQIKDGHQLSPLRTPAVPRMLVLNHHPQDSHP